MSQTERIERLVIDIMGEMKKGKFTLDELKFIEAFFKSAANSTRDVITRSEGGKAKIQVGQEG